MQHRCLRASLISIHQNPLASLHDNHNVSSYCQNHPRLRTTALRLRLPIRNRITEKHDMRHPITTTLIFLSLSVYSMA